MKWEVLFMHNKKVSIVVPCYGTEKYVERCVDSLLNQTYKNIEVIVVDDCSPNGMSSILKDYAENDKRVKIVTHKVNKGLFQARLSGADAAKGNYICFVDSDDYVAVDYIRNLVKDIEDKKADMVFCNTILDEKDGQYVYNLFDFHIDEINGSDCLDYYFSQKGVCYRWHTVWNKLYTIDLWKKARKYYNDIKTHLIMTEDFAFSTVLFYFCKKIVFNEYAYYYYCSNDDASTSLAKPNIKKFEKNIGDIFISFDFVKNFLRKVKVYSKYKDEYLEWYNLYLKIWHDNVYNSTLEDEEKDILYDKLLKKKSDLSEVEYKNELNFYNVKTKFNDEYEKIVKKICDDKIQIVSFDIFDTLIVRPFFEPKDLFKLLNKKYRDLDRESSIVFSDVREQAERFCRELYFEEKKREEVTLDEIYAYIQDNYLISNKVLNEMKKYEIKLEMKYCMARNSGKNLYELAKSLNKRIIVISDIYLSKDVISDILEKNGYDKLDTLYLSSDINLSKATGNLFDYVAKKEKIAVGKILHVGDNYDSDFSNGKKCGMNTVLLPKATEVMRKYYNKIFLNNYNFIDTTNFLSFSGIRNSLAMVANKFFDNPFVSFNEDSDFNSDPALIGYFALGMHTFALTKWMYDDVVDKKYDSLVFMARDGFLLKKQFDLLVNTYNKNIITSYLPISRKSLVPYSFTKKEDYIKLLDYFPYDTVSASDMYNLLDDILVDDVENDGSNLNKFTTYDEFSKFLISHIIPFIDEKKLFDCRNKLKEYFLQFYKEKSANFDIGYSAKPENTLSRLLDKSIDTYFVHFNDNNGYYYSNSANFDLNVLYDYKPRFTGLLREYMFSELVGSCKKYDCSGDKVKVIYDDFEVDYYEKWILDIIQNYSLRFTEDMLNLFADDLSEIFFPKFYMSIPYEYYLHRASYVDRQVFCNLMFENTINDLVDIELLWKKIVDESNSLGQVFIDNSGTYESITGNFYNLNVLHRNKFVKLLYYSFFDRVSLRNKIKNKLGENSLIFKTSKKIYHFIKK